MTNKANGVFQDFNALSCQPRLVIVSNCSYVSCAPFVRAGHPSVREIERKIVISFAYVARRASIGVVKKSGGPDFDARRRRGKFAWRNRARPGLLEGTWMLIPGRDHDERSERVGSGKAGRRVARWAEGGDTAAAAATPATGSCFHLKWSITPSDHPPHNRSSNQAGPL